jgi:hypothetical protein
MAKSWHVPDYVLRGVSAPGARTELVSNNTLS